MSDKRRRWITLGIVALIVLGCASILGIRLLKMVFPLSISSPNMSVESPLGEGEAIAFSYMRLDILKPFEIYTLDNTDGIRLLSQGVRRSDINPTWYPDGRQLVYLSVSGWETHIILVDADGANRREIAMDDSYKALLRWSPDGSYLAYLSYGQEIDGTISDSPQLCVAEVATGDIHQTSVGNLQDMVWMPDSQSLLAVVWMENMVSIEKYDANANHERRISEADFLLEGAAFAISPDASKVAYIDYGAEDDSETVTDSLLISSLDGATTKFIGRYWIEGSIVWSPDSERIAFVGLTGKYEYALYVVNADGTELRELILINTYDESGEILPPAPAWSPDSRRIAIGSLSSPEGSALFVMNADGSEQHQILTIASNTGMIYDLAWRPGE